MSKPAKRKHNECEVYQSKDGYRWRYWRAQKIVAESGESYTRARDAWRGYFAFIFKAVINHPDLGDA